MCSEKGQTLMELVVVVGVSVIVVGALVFATIASLRNAQFAKNQAQATKLAQEGIEKIRGLRDRNSAISTTIIDDVNNFSDLFTKDLAHDYCNTTVGDTPCYFRFFMNVLTQGTSANFEGIDLFTRQVLIGDRTISSCGATDYDKYCNQKTVTVIVTWTDFSGPHESRLTTILRKI